MSRKGDVARVAGRPYWRRAEARVIVGAWQDSGETVSRFARRHGVDPRRLSRWASRLRRREGVPVRFHRVRVAGEGAGSGGGPAIEIELSCGRRVRVAHGFMAEDLRRVLAVLEEETRC